MKLSTATLTQLPVTIHQPTYAREQLQTKIVHLGFGAFHRAHQAVYADKLASEHQSDWGYCEVNLIGGEQQTDAVNQQDGLYSVSEMTSNHWQTRVIGVIQQALHTSREGIETILTTLSQPEIAIVSITVTE